MRSVFDDFQDIRRRAQARMNSHRPVLSKIACASPPYFEGTSDAKIQAGCGHGKDYWKGYAALATEAFANLLSSVVVNKSAYDRIK